MTSDSEKGATFPLTSPTLLAYLREWGIGGETARKECLEICVSILLVWLFEEREKFR